MSEEIGIRITADYDGGDLADANKDVRQLDQSLRDLADTGRQTKQQLDAAGDEMAELGEEVEDANADLRRLDDRLTETAKSARELREETAELGDDQRTLAQRLEDTYQAFKEARAESIALKSEFKGLARNTDATLEQFEALSKEIAEAEESEYELIVRTRILMGEMRGLGDEAGYSNRTLNILNRELNQSEKYITGLGNAEKAAIRNARGLNEAVRDVAGGVGRMNDTLERNQGLLGRVGDKVGQLGDRLTSWGERIKSGIAASLTDLAVNAFQDLARAAVEWVEDANAALVEYDANLRQVFTLVPQLSGQARRALSADVLKLNTDIGRLSDETLPALYQAVSLGIDEDNALNAIAVASDAARAGNAELLETMTLGQSIVNAYGADVYDLTRVYDLLFFAIKNGAVTMPELLQGMSEITSVAGEAKVPLEDVVSAIVVMTKQGDTFNEAAGLMSNMLTQLQIDGTALGTAFREASGAGFRDFIAAGGTLAEALQLIQQHAEDTGQSITEMVGGDSPFFRDQQAMRGTLELTGGHLQEFLALTSEARQSQGLMAEASAEVADSLAAQQAKTDAATERLKILVAEGLRPTKEAWLALKAAVAEGLGDTIASGNEARSLKEELEALGLARSQIREVEAAVFAGGGDLEVQLRRNAAAIELLAAGYDLAALNAGQFAYEIDQLIAAQDEAAHAAEQAARLDSMSGIWEERTILAERYASRLNEVVTEATNAHEVLSVLDGDTVRIEFEGEVRDVRFRNVNAPEIAHGDEAAMPWAVESMHATQAYFDAHPLSISTTLDRESYGRIIAGVPELERQLVASGLALPLPVELTENEDFTEELEALAFRAAALGQGMFEDQALRVAYLKGEVDDLNVYYAELLDSQQALTPAFNAAGGAVAELYQAYDALSSVEPWDAAGIRQAQQDIFAAKESIVASLQEIAYETYLAQNGVNETTIALGVQAGLFSEQEGAARLEFALTSQAIQELIGRQHELGLSNEELIEATRLLSEGLAETPEDAAAAARGLAPLESELDRVRRQAADARQALLEMEGEYSATFTTTYYEYRAYQDLQDANEQIGPDGPQARGRGGPVRAGVPYLVGDDDGRLTPYSELFVPDVPGTILDPRETAALLANGAGGAGSVTTTAPAGQTVTIERIEIHVQAAAGRTDDYVAPVRDGLLDALRQVGLHV